MQPRFNLLPSTISVVFQPEIQEGISSQQPAPPPVRCPHPLSSPPSPSPAQNPLSGAENSFSSWVKKLNRLTHEGTRQRIKTRGFFPPPCRTVDSGGAAEAQHRCTSLPCQDVPRPRKAGKFKSRTRQEGLARCFLYCLERKMMETLWHSGKELRPRLGHHSAVPLRVTSFP